MQTTDADEVHARKVAAIAAQLRERAFGGETVHIHKGGVHHFVPMPNDKRFAGPRVDVSALREVLEVDAAARTCTAEPGVTFAEVVQKTLEHGLIPTVVPELEGITLGGAVAGCSVESMSHRYGGFHDSCVEYELISGAGEVLTLSPAQEPLLFGMVHGSYGTLGILSKLKFRLVPAGKFVRLEYRTYASAPEFHTALLERCAAGDYDFIDGIVHGPREFVLCLGSFVETAPYVSNYRWLEVFYKSTLARSEDYLTTFDYCFRYDTECHWLSRTVPPLEWKPVRFLLGKVFLGSTNLIKWTERLEGILALKKRPDVVVDVFIPSSRCPEFYSWYEREFRYYPLWVVPYRIPEKYPWLDGKYAVEKMKGELFLDLAVYGKPNGEPHVDYSQLLEDQTYQLGGIKTLISRNHYTRERFWEIYNRPNYQAAKERLDPGKAFPDLFDKFHRGS